MKRLDWWRLKWAVRFFTMVCLTAGVTIWTVECRSRQLGNTFSDEFNNQIFSSMVENVECAKWLNYRIEVGTFCIAVDGRCIAIGNGWMDVWWYLHCREERVSQMARLGCLYEFPACLIESPLTHIWPVSLLRVWVAVILLCSLDCHST